MRRSPPAPVNSLIQEIPIGPYTVTATASGFQVAKIDKVPVTAGHIYTLPIKLSVAQAAETVEVNAAALTLDTTSTTQIAGVEGAELQDTPLNGRDFTQLIIVTPGFANTGAGGYGALNGTRANQINWQIDGIDNNDLWHNIPAVNQGGVSGIAGIILPIDAIEQFSVQTQAGPESGRNPGGSVNLSLKSGTNQLHGTAYYFNRNEALGATNPFTIAADEPKQVVRNYNYGFSARRPRHQGQALRLRHLRAPALQDRRPRNRNRAVDRLAEWRHGRARQIRRSSQPGLHQHPEHPVSVERYRRSSRRYGDHWRGEQLPQQRPGIRLQL